MAVSKTSMILRDLAKRLPMQRHRACLYVAAPHCMTRGLLIERTPYKDTVYVRSLNLAFFRAHPFIHLTYSPRLGSSLNRDYFDGSPADIANLILQAVERDELAPTFTHNPGPADFLRAIDLGVNRTSCTALMDRAACESLLGRTDEAIGSFLAAEAAIRSDMARYSRPPWAETDATRCRGFAEQLQNGKDITAELRRICHDHALALGFQPAPLG